MQAIQNVLLLCSPSPVTSFFSFVLFLGGMGERRVGSSTTTAGFCGCVDGDGNGRNLYKQGAVAIALRAAFFFVCSLLFIDRYMWPEGPWQRLAAVLAGNGGLF